jgi:hypothetical protein
VEGLLARPAETKTAHQETPMNAEGNQTATKRRRKDQEIIRSMKPKVPRTEWKLADDQLDDALRQTFPASDALSVVQSARRT